MERFLFSLSTVIENFTAHGWNYYISIGVFVLCILMAMCALFGMICFKKPKKSLFGLFVFYQIAFLTNVALCITECVYCGDYFKSTAEAYAYCLAQFAVLICFWLMIKADTHKVKEHNVNKKDKNKVTVQEEYCANSKCPIIDLYVDLLKDLRIKSIESKTDKRKLDEIVESDKQFCGLPSDRRLFSANIIAGAHKGGSDKTDCVYSNKSNYSFDDCLAEDRTEDRLVDYTSNEKQYMPDINVAYINNLISALFSKNIQPDERERLEELKRRLCSLPTRPNELNELNELLRFLLKKIAEYDITA